MIYMYEVLGELNKILPATVSEIILRYYYVFFDLSKIPSSTCSDVITLYRQFAKIDNNKWTLNTCQTILWFIFYDLYQEVHSMHGMSALNYLKLIEEKKNKSVYSKLREKLEGLHEYYYPLHFYKFCEPIHSSNRVTFCRTIKGIVEKLYCFWKPTYLFVKSNNN